MKRRILLALGAAVAALTLVSVAIAGVTGAHFVGNPTITTSGNTTTASGKVAGLGNVEQIEVTVSGDAACINPGSKKPQAANKESFSATGTFPVQNGKAEFSLTLTATFKPDCTPPMTVEWSNIQITVTAPGVSLSFP
jgi:hypothetical protein